jgi:hypothetical protein
MLMSRIAMRVALAVLVSMGVVLAVADGHVVRASRGATRDLPPRPTLTPRPSPSADTTARRAADIRWAQSSSRWQTSDTATSRADIPYTLHPYAYALSNPVLYTDPSGLCVFLVVDTLICVGGLTFTIGQAIALVAATGAATYATYAICVAQGTCDRLATDLEHALQQRQTTASSAPTLPRDGSDLPSIPGTGGACAANASLTHEGATQAIQTAEANLSRAEGLPRSEITLLYRGTSLKSVYEPRVPLWTTPWLFTATVYADTNAAIDRSSPVIAVYSIPTMLLRAMVASGTVRTRFAGIRGSEYGFMSAAQPFLFAPVVIPVPPHYPGY